MKHTLRQKTPRVAKRVRLLAIVLVGLSTSGAFAKTNIAFSVAPDFYNETFEANNIRYVRTGKTDFAFSAFSSTYFGSRQFIGFFNRLTFSTAKDFSLFFETGPSFNFPVYGDFLHVALNPALRAELCLEKDSELFALSKNDYYRFSLGFATDVHFIFIPTRRICPVLGIDLSLSPFARSYVYQSGESYYLAYTYFLAPHASPYVAVMVRL